MKTFKNKTAYKKIALALSIFALFLWCILGTGASLAWFADASPEVNNIFHFADFDIDVSHRLTDGKWEQVTSTTKVFDDEALYEPGYVQIVYLKVENKGDVAFNYDMAVHVTGVTLATNTFGQTFNLQDHLKFGVVSATTETEMKNSIPDREQAKLIANQKLNNYYKTDPKPLGAGETAYIAIVVRMPEEVTNIANYRGNTQPKVELGIIVKAEQIHN